jgi:hypothetical protein
MAASKSPRPPFTKGGVKTFWTRFQIRHRQRARRYVSVKNGLKEKEEGDEAEHRTDSHHLRRELSAPG